MKIKLTKFIQLKLLYKLQLKNAIKNKYILQKIVIVNLVS